MSKSGSQKGCLALFHLLLPCDPQGRLTYSLLPFFSQFGPVMTLTERGLRAPEEDCFLSLWRCGPFARLSAPHPVILFGPEPSFCQLSVPQDAVVVLGRDHPQARAFAAAHRLRLMDCSASPQASLTLSSLEQERAVLALQRSLVTLGGETVEPQEFFVEGFGAMNPEDLLCGCGVLLLCGKLPFACEKQKKG